MSNEQRATSNEDAAIHNPQSAIPSFELTFVCLIIFLTMLLHEAQYAIVSCEESINTVNALQNKDETRYTLVILPFHNHTEIPTAATSAEDLLRSELIKTGYFNIIEREETYETIVEFVPNDNLYIGGYKFNDTFISKKGQDLADRKETKHKGEIGWLDMPIGIERHAVIKLREKLNAAFAITGTINQFGEKMRFDIELIGARDNRTLASLTAEAEGFERFPDIVNFLTLDVTKVCRRFNAQLDANNIVSRYKQGLYTYEVTIQKLDGLSSIIPDSLAPQVALLSIYLEQPGMEEKIIATGEKILTLFDPQQNEHLEILQSMGIDPFDELAKKYEIRGGLDKVIETHSRAIKTYPLNTLRHYKGLALAYKRRGMEQQHIEALRKALLIYNTDPDIYYCLGAAMERAGKFEQAIENYRKCVKYTNDVSLTTEIKKKISQIESTK